MVALQTNTVGTLLAFLIPQKLTILAFVSNFLYWLQEEGNKLS